MKEDERREEWGRTDTDTFNRRSFRQYREGFDGHSRALTLKCVWKHVVLVVVCHDFRITGSAHWLQISASVLYRRVFVEMCWTASVGPLGKRTAHPLTETSFNYFTWTGCGRPQVLTGSGVQMNAVTYRHRAADFGDGAGGGAHVRASTRNPLNVWTFPRLKTGQMMRGGSGVSLQRLSSQTGWC